MSHSATACNLHLNNVNERDEKVEANLFEITENLYETLNRQNICIHLAWKDGFFH